jgi:GR25 family glycosyltransferase involved in LPS biosynthesis
VWVINSKRRPDRLARFWSEIGKGHWPFRRPQIFNAIEGDKVGVPKFWQTGGGSYGCLRSHLVLLERAIQDDVTTGHFERH